MEGQLLGAYRIERELGSGGMGRVYLAHVTRETAGLDVGTGVAVKVIHRHLFESEGFFKRFLREADIGRAVRHENVVRTYDVDAILLDERQRNFLVMEYVEGQTLRSLLEELDHVPEELCRHIGREVSKGLCAIHEAGVIHRDLKPENVLITEDHVVKIMDLGVARHAAEELRLSIEGSFVGSVLYASPEQFRKGGAEVDHRSDLYGMGLLLYELATGRHPLGGDDLRSAMQRHLEVDPRPAGELNPQLSPFLEELLATLLKKEPGDRFGSAGDLLEALELGEESEWWRLRASTLREETRRPLRRIRILRETSLYGREDELARLRSFYQRAAEGGGRAVLVEGEGGIGKSRLVDEFVGRLEAEGEDLHFLFGRNPPGGAATAAGAFASACHEHFGDDSLEEILGDYLPATPALVPAFAALLRGEPPPPGREPLTKDSLQALFVQTARALARERPTIVLIDDLHFAPREGRALFAALAHAVPGHPLLLVGTFEPPMDPAWTAGLDRLEHVSRLTLGRLGAKDLGELLIDAFGSRRLARELALPIATKSDGNPFFVFEIVRDLRESGKIVEHEQGTWATSGAIGEIEIPSSVTDLIHGRIAALTQEERSLLDAASCCGLEFDPRLLSEALGMAAIPVLQQLAHIEEEHHLVRSVGRRYVFDHAQVRNALYSRLAAPLREEYHAALADALETRGSPAGQAAVDLCDHLLRGARGERALTYLSPALDHLEAGYRNEIAADLATRALAEEGLIDGRARIRLLLRHARRLGLLGRRREERAALEEARDLSQAEGDERLRASAWLELSRHLFNTGSLEEAERAVGRSVEFAVATGDRRTEIAARLAECPVLGRIGRPEEARERLEALLVDLEEVDDRVSSATALGNLGTVLGVLGRYEEARDRHERELGIWLEIGDRRGEAGAHGSLGNLQFVLGHYDDARGHFERYLALSRQVGDTPREAQASGSLGNLHGAMGRLEEAIARHERCLELARRCGLRHTEAVALVNRGTCRLRLGELRAAAEGMDRAIRIGRDDGNRIVEGMALVSRGEVRRVSGELQTAESSCREGLRVLESAAAQSNVDEALLRLGEVLADRGEDEEAAAVFDRAVEVAAGLREPGSLVLALAHRALLPGGDPLRAERELSAHEPRLHHHDRTQIRWALFRATGDSAHLEEAHRLVAHLTEHAPAESREVMVERVPLYREITQAWADRGGV